MSLQVGLSSKNAIVQTSYVSMHALFTYRGPEDAFQVVGHHPGERALLTTGDDAGLRRGKVERGRAQRVAD